MRNGHNGSSNLFTFPSCGCIYPALKELKQPKIMANLIDQTVMKGEPVKLKASIRGDPQPQVHWFKDGKIANETDGVEILKSEDGFTYELFIEKATEKHHGLYEVLAKNEHGEAESKVSISPYILLHIYFQVMTIESIYRSIFFFSFPGYCQCFDQA